MTDINGFNSDTTFQDGLNSDSIHDLGNTVNIELSENTINLVAQSVLVNGAPISGGGGGVQNPLTSNLNIATYDVVNNTGLSLTGINSKTRHITADNDFTIVGSILQAPIMRTDSIADYDGDVSSIDLLQTGIQMFVAKTNPMFNFNDKPIVYTPYPNQIQADSFKMNGAVTGAGEYLMSDGSTVKYSQNSGNSNFYLYNHVYGASSPPVVFNNGTVSYNSDTLSVVTQLYIVHISRDNIDIEIFYSQISSINDLYIQDQNNSDNFIKYNITSSSYIPNQYLTLNVSVISYGGTGQTNFGNGHNILISFFQNSPEISSRLSQLELKTTNIASVSTGINTQFQGNLTSSGFVKTGSTSNDILLGNGTTTSLSAISSYDTRITAVETKTQYQSVVSGDTSFSSGIRLNGIGNMDVETWSRPFIGLQFAHNSAVQTTLSNSPWTVLGNGLVVSPFAITSNATRQLCSVLATPSGASNGAQTGVVSTSLTGARVLTSYTFGLVASFSIADSGTYITTNCQNFIGLWNLAPALVLNQTIQLSTQRNFIAFGSNTTDTNLCIYTAGTSSTVKQVDLGVYFPSNRPAVGVSSDWFQLSLYFDGIRIHYRAINTLYANVAAANISGSFAPLATDFPINMELYPQMLRIMGTPQVVTQAKLQIQRFGVIL